MSDYCHKIGHGPAMMDSDCLKEDCLVCEIERLQAGKDMLGAMVSQDAETIAMLEARVATLEGFIHTYTEGEFVDDLAAVKAGREALAATEPEGET